MYKMYGFVIKPINNRPVIGRPIQVRFSRRILNRQSLIKTMKDYLEFFKHTEKKIRYHEISSGGYTKIYKDMKWIRIHRSKEAACIFLPYLGYVTSYWMKNRIYIKKGNNSIILVITKPLIILSKNYRYSVIIESGGRNVSEFITRTVLRPQ